ncbi:MAG: hypothetical protein C0459_14485 [Chitinophaga sp.]|jgi:Protein of unknown function (DUF1761)|nr:hypothetical protein [Chitinophaga sp.]
MFNQLLSSVNWLHVLVAAVAYFMLGAIWYSALFQKQWIAMHKIDVNAPDAKKGAGVIFGIGFLLTIVIVAGIAIFKTQVPAINLVGGIKLGLFASVVFCSPPLAMSHLYLKKPFALIAIDCAYHIIGSAIAGAIIGAWQ